ncbi:MAG: hypothetical protein JSS10_00340 [Verrucomicrobia bacterium]|nr:hypothetical protein [Verrucomicrobiota bacterium]
MAAVFDPFLHSQITQMYNTEQKLLRAMQWCCLPKHCIEHRTLLQRLRDKHLLDLKTIVFEFEWPGKSLIGEDGVERFWTLIQHCDQEVIFQELCLQHLNAAVKNQEASRKYIPFLHDRVLINRGLKQLYGTQLRIVDKQLVACPIAEPDQLERRRKEYDMEPISEYFQKIKGRIPKRVFNN